MTDDRRHMDLSALEMFLILKHNTDLRNARTIDSIINRDEAPVAGQKRGHDSDNTSVCELNSSF